ncbi:MAG TPA: adenylate/guanylate cyclase domain-containing protein [Acidimicrobiia bacterium]
MPKLSQNERAKLPDTAFAYIDSRGRRMLPIHDEAHVRNALARFGQVKYESDQARERARKRLLVAAKKYGLVPVGFIAGQFETERRHAAAGRVVIELGSAGAPGLLEQQLRKALGDPTLTVLHWSEAAGAFLDSTGSPTPLPGDESSRAVTFLERDHRRVTAIVHDPAALDDPALSQTVLDAIRYVIERERQAGEVHGSGADLASMPTGFVTLLFADIEGSTPLVRRLGDSYAPLLRGVREVMRKAVTARGGREVEARADEYFAVFESPHEAVGAAVDVQRSLARATFADDVSVRVRIGLHTGLVTLTDDGYIGLAVNTASRVCSIAHGGQIVVSGETRLATGDGDSEITWRGLGRRRFAGLVDTHELYQVMATGLMTDFPPLRRSPVRKVGEGS